MFMIFQKLKKTADNSSHQVEKNAASTDADSAMLAKQLQKDIKDYVGVSASIEICDAGSVARSEGKAVRVVDERE